MASHPGPTLAWLFLAFCSLAPVTFAATHEPVDAGAGVIERARETAVPLEGIDTARPGSTLTPGDTLAALITLRDRGRTRQWLAEFRADALSEAEAKALPAATTVHLSTGKRFEFSSRLAALELRMSGPFDERPRAKPPGEARTARLLVKTDYLAAGFARHCEIILRARASGTDLPLQPAAKPFPAKRSAHDRALAEKIGLSPDDERALAATGPALGEFLGIAQSTPVLEELLHKVADFPAVWRLIAGGKTGFFFEAEAIVRLDARDWNLPPGTAVYRAPFHYYFRGSKLMQGEFCFTEPQPPLLTCAGILSVHIASPKNPQRTLDLRILSARHGTSLAP